jgi:hypothetical protein
MDKDYKKLYIKYKSKYLKLKKILGGTGKARRQTATEISGQTRPVPYETERAIIRIPLKQYVHMTLLSNLPSIIYYGLGTIKQGGIQAFNPIDPIQKYTYFIKPDNENLKIFYTSQLLTSIAESLTKDDVLQQNLIDNLKITVAFITYETHTDIIKKHPKLEGEYITENTLLSHKIKSIEVLKISNFEFPGSIKFKIVEDFVYKEIDFFYQEIISLRYNKTLNINEYTTRVNEYLTTNFKPERNYLSIE